MNPDFIEGKPMLRLTFGSNDYVLPWETGVQILNLMRDAIPVKRKYDGAYQRIGWEREEDGLTATAFSPA